MSSKTLTNKQRVIIKEWVNRNKNKVSEDFNCLVEGLDIYEKVSRVRETETLHYDINRFIRSVGGRRI